MLILGQRSKIYLSIYIYFMYIYLSSLIYLSIIRKKSF